MNRVKKNKKKGFTLVELMIVVVIMIILAAAASPIFKGYLDRAKQARYLAECRTVYVAAQTVAQDFLVADQKFSSSITIDSKSSSHNQTTNATSWSDADFAANVLDLAGLAKPTSGESYAITFDSTNNIKEIVYTGTDGTTVTFKPEASAVEVAPSSAAG